MEVCRQVPGKVTSVCRLNFFAVYVFKRWTDTIIDDHSARGHALTVEDLNQSLRHRAVVDDIDVATGDFA
jgi:hypothetical protein